MVGVLNISNEIKEVDKYMTIQEVIRVIMCGYQGIGRNVEIEFTDKSSEWFLYKIYHPAFSYRGIERYVLSLPLEYKTQEIELLLKLKQI
jgi:hypothetical protein